MRVNVFAIESEKPRSATSISCLYKDVTNSLGAGDRLGEHQFRAAESLPELSELMSEFVDWTKSVDASEPIVLWLSVHGLEPSNPDAVGTAARAASGDKVEWYRYLQPILNALEPRRIVVVMDVCWGGSPAAPARLLRANDRSPWMLFGPRFRAERWELDPPTRAIFNLVSRCGMPCVADATELVDSVNRVELGEVDPYYRVWWRDSSGFKQHPSLNPEKLVRRMV